MTPATHYQPVFTGLTNNWHNRWQLIREFSRRWYDIPLATVGSSRAFIEQEERRLGLILPPAVEEWIGYWQEMLEQFPQGMFGDFYETDWVDNESALSLIIEADESSCWAVRREDLDQDDPPVQRYRRQRGGQLERFVHSHQEAPHLTSFLLQYLAQRLSGKGGGGQIVLAEDHAFLHALEQAFPVSVHVDHLHIFEKSDLIAVLYRPAGQPGIHHLIVEAWQNIPVGEIPACIRQRTEGQGVCRTLFAS